MTEAESCIADLNAALAEFGDIVVLQRMTADPTSGAQTVANEVNPCPAAVRSHQPQDLVPMPGDAPASLVIISPTALAVAGWPGYPQKDDRVILDPTGIPRNANVEIVSPISIAGQVVRIEIQCRE